MKTISKNELNENHFHYPPPEKKLDSVPVIGYDKCFVWLLVLMNVWPKTIPSHPSIHPSILPFFRPSVPQKIKVNTYIFT